MLSIIMILVEIDNWLVMGRHKIASEIGFHFDLVWLDKWISTSVTENFPPFRMSQTFVCKVD